MAGDDDPVREPPVLLLVTGPPGTGKSTVAEYAAGILGAAVLGWDWAMAALTSFAPVQEALASLSKADYHGVGWSILGNLATAQLRRGDAVVLDGVARAEQIAGVRAVAQACGARFVLIATWCDDPTVHRSRIEGRTRAIPGWHELDWEHVADVRSRWEHPPDASLSLDAGASRADNEARVARMLAVIPPS
jgi:predicted kinase